MTVKSATTSKKAHTNDGEIEQPVNDWLPQESYGEFSRDEMF